MQSEDYNLVSLVLPPGILGFFSIKKVAHTEKVLNIYLEEKNIKPEDFKAIKLTSKGFLMKYKFRIFQSEEKMYFFLSGAEGGKMKRDR